MEVDSKKLTRKNDVLVPEMKKLVFCVFAVGHNDVTHSQCGQLGKRHHTHNSVFFFCFIFIDLITTSIF